jgi:hypothetical protein
MHPCFFGAGKPVYYATMTTGILKRSLRRVSPLHTRHTVVLLSLVLAFLAADTFLWGQTTKPVKKTSAVTPPKWYTNVPKDTANLVTRGKGEGKDQQLAIDRAIMAAREEIVAIIEKQWKELLLAIRNEGIVANEPQIESITLQGSKTTKQKASKSKKTWTAFVLVSFPKSSVPPLLLDRAHHSEPWYSQVRHSNAIRELEAAVR